MTKIDPVNPLVPGIHVDTVAESARMRCVDTSSNPRIPILMEMIASVSRATEPQQVYERFSRGIRRLNGQTAYISLSVRGLAPGQYKITRLRLTESGEQTQQDPWRNWNALEVHTGGILGEISRQAYPELIHYLDVNDDPVLGDALTRFKCMMAVPLFDNGEPLNWAIFLAREPEHFTVADLEESLLRANLVGGMTKNTVVSKQLREANERITQQFEQIADIQRGLLPERMPEIPGVVFAASYEPSERAGGDYYDLFPIDLLPDGSPRPGGRWIIMIADASGHGPSAAVVMAMLHAIVHAYPGPQECPGKLLEFANDHLCEKRLEGSFVTAFLAVFDPNARTFTYARAGHNPPLLKNAGSGGSVSRLQAVGGLPLGIEPGVVYDDHVQKLETGQSVLLYTDGITEAMNDDGQMFGVSGIEEALTECTGDPVCSMGSINGALEEFTDGGARADDQTLLALKLLE